MSKELLRLVYTEASKGNPQPLLDSLADEIRWTIIGSAPLSGTYVGRREVVENLFARLRARLTGPVSFSFERFIEDGEYVVMQASGQATAIGGAPYENTYCNVARIVNGKIREMTDYVDTELITKALFSD